MAVKAAQKSITALNQFAKLSAADAGTATVVITTDVAWDGDLDFEASGDGTHFQSANGFNSAAATYQRTWSGANQTAQFLMICGGKEAIRVNCSRYVAGTALVTILAGAASPGVVLMYPLPAGSQEIGSVRTKPAASTFTDRSGTIAVGGTAQSLAPANTARRYLFIQNTGSLDLWFNFTTPAIIGQPSIKLVPGDWFPMEGTTLSSEAVSIIGGTTNQPYTAKEIVS